MARLPRIVIPGQPLHIIQRGNNRAPCFYAEDDYHRYLGDLQEARVRNDGRLHVYLLMTNHVHLLLMPEAVASPAAKGAGEDRVTGTIGKRQTAAYTF
jgi:putative transposase